VRSVAYRGVADLLEMQRLVQRVWLPAARWHVGDVAWERRWHHEPFDGWPTQLWRDEADEVVAWAWRAGQGRVELCVEPGAAKAIEAALDWALGHDVATELTVTVAEGDLALRGALEARGLAVEDRPAMACLRHDLIGLPAVRCPDGFAVHALTDDADALAARVEVHRAAWASTTLTTDVYRTVQATWPYRFDLDVVVEHLDRASGDATFSASCLAWYDERNAVGLLQPVGTDPAWRRRGLAAAACTEVLRRLKALGATGAIVATTTDASYTAPIELYRSIGFTETTTSVTYRRDAS
jgi:ribosomal protein S18 acetylase RimI-like enzyme